LEIAWDDISPLDKEKRWMSRRIKQGTKGKCGEAAVEVKSARWCGHT